ncbi:hypothetical protein SAMN06297229_1455 [Pseudidiomarina planktonica]|uniref:Yip1 domain-containing protein n=1 Tax=Pseudidiomarina planktonica TaxID=1323738 RepID=A0A1Y6F121_9GAMM|nr:hypothetical protein [Pseudidiomarina planktonica]RUO65176.1 hypothetical protein CWI77_01495 [Pseudidiomarina planktonica]SMQ66163.1 hypothetical protein SAMN06297229_1455 [Pseudidiomarina planktonica]
MFKLPDDIKKNNYLGIAWLAAMLNIFFYLPIGIILVMLSVMAPEAPTESAVGTLSQTWNYIGAIFSLVVWVASLVYLVMNSRFSTGDFKTAFRYSVIPVVGLAVAAAGIVAGFFVFLVNSVLIAI